MADPGDWMWNNFGIWQADRKRCHDIKHSRQEPTNKGENRHGTCGQNDTIDERFGLNRIDAGLTPYFSQA